MQEAAGYGWPKFGECAELRSLAYHCGLRRRFCKEPGNEKITLALNSVLRVLSCLSWQLPSDFLKKSHYERCIRSLDWTSSPGYPYCLEYTTNSQLFKVKDGVPSSESVDRVWELVSQRLLTMEADPIRIFVKPEPHKQKKLDTERYRLISSVSVVDQIIDHMLFGDMNDLVVEQFGLNPIKVGWSPYVGGWKIMPKQALCADKSSWDWTVRPWILEFCYQVRRRLCRSTDSNFVLWCELSEKRYQLLFGNPLLVTSGGLIIRQKNPGVMKSGCVNTIVDNSIGQLLLHTLVCMELGEEVSWINVMGDDTMQSPLEREAEYLDELSNYCIVKEATHKVEFAGMQFEGMKVEPSYHAKHCFNLLHIKDSVIDSMVSSYALLYHRSHRREKVYKVLREISSNIPMDEVLDLIYDG